ncbi:MAG: YfiR family protein [Flavobacteriales bacterium]
MFLFSGVAYAQQGNKDTKAIYKAAYLFSFTKLVDWPSSYKKGEFTIGLLASEDTKNLYRELRKKYEDKKVGDQSLTITEYSSPEEVDKGCNILFIGERSTSSLGDLKRQNQSTLLVAERKGALQKGAVINFVIKNNKLEYELSRNNAERYGLTIGNQLRKLAYKVH